MRPLCWPVAGPGLIADRPARPRRPAAAEEPRRRARRPPRRPVAPDPPKPVDTDLWGGTGSPWGYVRRLPPPTPESQIQPRYREASTLRPQFAESGTAPTR